MKETAAVHGKGRWERLPKFNGFTTVGDQAEYDEPTIGGAVCKACGRAARIEWLYGERPAGY
ncbi:MAG: hypothetical protein ABJE47_22285 [bacterium]